MRGEDLKNVIKKMVLEKLDLSKEINDQGILDIIEEVIYLKSRECYISIKQKSNLKKEVFNSIRRLDVLQELVENEEITEIMVNGPDYIFMEKEGELYPWNRKFETKEKLEDIVQQIVSKSNRVVNETNPIVDVRLEDGSRVNVVLPPVAIDGPAVTIRKFPKEPVTMERLIEWESISREAAEFLKKMVQAKYNIFISGGTGSGKTTFLNALSNFISREERIITIEDSAELQILNIPNLVRLEARNANIEGNYAITIRDLIKTALRMRPSRILVGEVRDQAAVDLLAAYNTGHDGSLSTGHGNNCKDMLERLETLYLMGMDIPLEAVRKQITSAIDIMIHLGRLRDKSRKVLEITEVLNDEEKGTILNPIFCFEEKGEDKKGKIKGNLKRTNNPFFYTEKLKRAGIPL